MRLCELKSHHNDKKEIYDTRECPNVCSNPALIHLFPGVSFVFCFALVFWNANNFYNDCYLVHSFKSSEVENDILRCQWRNADSIR